MTRSTFDPRSNGAYDPDTKIVVPVRLTKSVERPWCRDLPDLIEARETFLKFFGVQGNSEGEGKADWFEANYPDNPYDKWIIRCKPARPNCCPSFPRKSYLRKSPLGVGHPERLEK
jgi:hypothetical protein